jgi:hypothetical protein
MATFGSDKSFRKLRILHVNAQGLRKKFEELKALTSKHRPHIIVVNECKLDFEKVKYNIKDYDKITDSKAEHLTTAMYIARGLRWTQTHLSTNWQDDDRRIEGVSIRLVINHTTGESINIKGVYIPIPNQHHARDEFEDILLESSAVVIGDMNLLMRILGHTRDRSLGTLVKRLIQENVCSLSNTGVPSRPNSQGNGILDTAILTHESQNIDRVSAKGVESIGSDHLPWMLDLHIDVDRERKLVRNMRAIYEDEELSRRYESIFIESMGPLGDINSNVDCDNFIERLEKSLTAALNEIAPLKEDRRRDHLPADIEQLIIDRNAARNKAWRFRHNQLRRPALRQEYNRLKHEVSNALCTLREESWLKIIEDPRSNRTQMWRIQRSMKTQPQKLPQIPNCITEKDTIDTLVDAAIVKEAIVAPEDEGTEKTTPFRSLDLTSTDEIKKSLRRFKNKKAPGPDQLRADALKLGGKAFLEAFKRVADYVLTTGYFPRRWKQGECIFLHKAGKNYREAKSYRPITLLNIMGKLCERLILARLWETSHRLQPPFQHGFTQARGTGTQILRTGKFITDALDAKDSVAMISTDLSKAFDSINHRGLIKKLQNKNVDNNIIKILENYLMDRTVRGKFRTTIGEEMIVPHGVPQGSILGPVVFNLYVHDIWDEHDRLQGIKLSQYADDLCVLNRAARPDQATTRAKWAAETVIDYYERWGLKCNVEKTECIMFTKKRGYKPTVKLKDLTLPFKKETKYLGVIFDKTMTMGPHTNLVTTKAKRVRGALSPIIGYYAKTDLQVKLAIIQACLLPVLDYGTVQLLPRYSKTNLLKIERQYRMALKAAAQFPQRIPTEMLWDTLDWDPWHIRVHDLHQDMLGRLKQLNIADLDTPGDAYLGYGQFNPLLSNHRIGDIPYIVNKKDRRLPLSKRAVAPRPHRL